MKLLGILTAFAGLLLMFLPVLILDRLTPGGAVAIVLLGAVVGWYGGKLAERCK